MVVSAVILLAWMPVGALLSQRDALSTANSRLTQLTAQGRALSAEATELSSPVAQLQLGSVEYQLVEPGQQLLEVLPPSVRLNSRSQRSPYAGDPGYAPIVNLITGALVRSPTVSPVTSGGSGPGFLSRVLGTLEFWR
jgi:hypothetical protein